MIYSQKRCLHMPLLLFSVFLIVPTTLCSAISSSSGDNISHAIFSSFIMDTTNSIKLIESAESSGSDSSLSSLTWISVLSSVFSTFHYYFRKGIIVYYFMQSWFNWTIMEDILCRLGNILSRISSKNLLCPFCILF